MVLENAEVFIEALSALLQCSRKRVLTYVGVAKDFPLEDEARPRLELLWRTVDYLLVDRELKLDEVHRVLTLPAYALKDNWKVSIISAIHDGPGKFEDLIAIARVAIRELRKSKPSPEKNLAIALKALMEIVAMDHNPYSFHKSFTTCQVTAEEALKKIEGK